MKNTSIVNASRIILALLFIFSGFTKWVDPAGSQIKFTEYFHAFGADALVPLSWPLAVLLPAAELFIGLMLAIGIYRRLFAWAALLFMSFFTLLTFVIWLFVPVSDCGCFGDFIKLGNGATFAKNLLFMAFAVILFMGRGASGTATGCDAVTASLLAVWSLLMPLYAAKYLPFVDFLPYGDGVDIRASMEIPEDADRGESRVRLLYRDRQTGGRRLFEIDDTTWYDTDRWEYLDTEHQVIRQGYTPPIASFSAVDAVGEEHGDRILSREGYVALVVIRSMDELSSPAFVENLDRLRGYAADCGVEVVAVTQLDLESLVAKVGEGVECLNMDETQLKSLVRSKSGLVLLHNGTIIAKRNMQTSLPQICGRSPEEILSHERRRDRAAMTIYMLIGSIIVGSHFVASRRRAGAVR